MSATTSIVIATITGALDPLKVVHLMPQQQQSARRSFARRAPPLQDHEDHHTLRDALDYALATRWQGLRSAKTARNQVELAITTLEAIVGEATAHKRTATTTARPFMPALVEAPTTILTLGKFTFTRTPNSPPPAGAAAHVELTVCEVTAQVLLAATEIWRAEGLAPATINRRLMGLSAIGVDVSGCCVTMPRRLKWWLRPSDQLILTAWLRGHRHHHDKLLLADWIDWTVCTGLRIEESLRLTRGDVEFYEAPDGKPKASITVPGLKTYMAQANLPIGDEARAILIARGMMTTSVASAPVFPITYLRLLTVWQLARAHLGVSDNPLATLKAIRRSAARYLHVAKGMPLDMLRQYLRHENINTTMGYLRLTGGYDRAEMDKWL